MRGGSSRTVILVHGGCGPRRPSSRALGGIRSALDAGYDVLERGGAALDAVEAAVAAMETSRLFNAGLGSKRQLDGVARMDASIMDGTTLAAGAVASLEDMVNPIRVARCVMETTPHVLLVGSWARRFARHHRIPSRKRSTAQERPSWRKVYRRLARPIADTGTVGAVARDANGRVAAATSTGGIRDMLPGRVGDSPLIGAGTYADDLAGAVSMTGVGEAIIRGGLARVIASHLAEGKSPLTAGRRTLLWMRRRIGGEAGAIIVAHTGACALLHTTRHMVCGVRRAGLVRVASHGTRLGGR